MAGMDALFSTTLAINALLMGHVFGTDFDTQVYELPHHSYIHDVALALDGEIWYTAQEDGQLGILDPKRWPREIPQAGLRLASVSLSTGKQRRLDRRRRFECHRVLQSERRRGEGMEASC